MNTPSIRTRFAPSPTGFLHIGGARSALYNYLWAKKNKGQFLLRIEDTDKQREVEGAIDAIKEGLRWIGVQWDEGIELGGPFGPYIQSERLDSYRKAVQDLLERKKAYYCFCTSERLDAMRKELQTQKKAPKYDRLCRSLPEAKIRQQIQEGMPYVVRLAVPEQGIVVVRDVIRGEIQVDVNDIDDQVLLKSDGYPTYHLANVVDDRAMKITHVIRGEEWIPSTPKHVLLYQAFGWEAPQFAHLTVFLSKQGGKMSKRHGETSLLAFRDNGYLPKAIVNFMALLGWNPKTEEEFFTLEQLVERFDLHQVNKANPIFETEKLDWMNQHYMKQLETAEMIAYLKYLAEKSKGNVDSYKNCVQWFELQSEVKRESVWKGMRERCKTFLEMVQSLESIQQIGEYAATDLVWKKSTPEKTKESLQKLIVRLGEIGDEHFLSSELEQQIIPWIKENGWGNGDVLWPMRFALSGQPKSPTPFELAELLGKEETIKRLRRAHGML